LLEAAVPIPSAQPPIAAAFGIAAAGPSQLVAPQRTSLSVGSAELNVLDGHRASVSGTLRDSHRQPLARRAIELQILTGRGWRTVSHGRTGARGRYHVEWAAHTLGTRRLRVRFPGDPLDLPSRRRVGSLNVYRAAMASWYGGGGSLACGGSLTSGTLGVANKTLPCGTLVTLHYNGRTVRVPVVDRGPFVEGREFDLTEATKQALGFEGVGEIWSTR
jgi:hypothetical protein